MHRRCSRSHSAKRRFFLNSFLAFPSQDNDPIKCVGATTLPHREGRSQSIVMKFNDNQQSSSVACRRKILRIDECWNSKRNADTTNAKRWCHDGENNSRNKSEHAQTTTKCQWTNWKSANETVFKIGTHMIWYNSQCSPMRQLHSLRWFPTMNKLWLSKYIH